MLPIKRFQVRGLPGEVQRSEISGRIVDFWAPVGGSEHLLIAHDGQNIFDRRTATRLRTWKLGERALRVSRELNQKPPTIIAVFHGSNKSDPQGRARDLCPEDPFREGMQPLTKPTITIDQLRANQYLTQIFDEIVPVILDRTNSSVNPERSAMIGSSMGGLATLYALTKFYDRFSTALALSPHWVLAGDPLVDWLISRIPNQKSLKVWMSRGTKGLDASYKPHQDRADQMMLDLDWGDRYLSKVFHRTAHNERSWSSYVDQPLRFWLDQSVNS